MAQGTLYLCATPIGNLGDMSPRIRETLSQVDLIACEDTRNSIRLLNHFEIHTPMTSYHEYNKVEKAYALIEKMKEGADIALITDAGTPAISDPGEVLVKMLPASRRLLCQGCQRGDFVLKLFCRQIKKKDSLF